MNRHIFQNILFLLLAIGCTKEPIKTIQNTLIIQGENVARFNTSRNTHNEGEQTDEADDQAQVPVDKALESAENATQSDDSAQTADAEK